MYCTMRERRNAPKIKKFSKKATFCFSRINLISLPEVKRYFQKAHPPLSMYRWKRRFLRAQKFLPSPEKCGRALKNFIPKAKSILADDLRACAFCGSNEMENTSERGKKEEGERWGLSGAPGRGATSRVQVSTESQPQPVWWGNRSWP